MAWREKLYERALKPPVDAGTLEAIRGEFERRRHEIPVPPSYWITRPSRR